MACTTHAHSEGLRATSFHRNGQLGESSASHTHFGVCVCFGVTRTDRSDAVLEYLAVRESCWQKYTRTAARTSDDVLGSTNQRLHLPQ